jgi:hypothetical protein
MGQVEPFAYNPMSYAVASACVPVRHLEVPNHEPLSFFACACRAVCKTLTCRSVELFGVH